MSDPTARSLVIATLLVLFLSNASQAENIKIAQSSSSANDNTPQPPDYKKGWVAIRSDDSFMFVANYTSGTLSEYGIAPGQGTLTVQPTVTAFPTPWGVAVK